jgi:hypothetical protein
VDSAQARITSAATRDTSSEVVRDPSLEASFDGDWLLDRRRMTRVLE